MAQRSKNVITRRYRNWLVLLGCGLMATACSMVKIGYEMVPTLAKWEISEYVTFDGSQQVMADQRLESLHEWHRSTQVPAYIDWLDQAVTRLEPLSLASAAGPNGQIRPELALSVQEVGQWRAQLLGHFDPLFQATARPFAELALTFTHQQLDQIDRRLKQNNEELHRKYRLRDDRATLDRRVERWQSRLEYFFGELTEKQQARLDRRVRALPPITGWWEGRLRRQASTMALLRRLATDKPEVRVATDEIRLAFREYGKSQDDSAARQSDSRVRRADQIVTDMLAIARPAQFAHARDLFAGFADDLRGVSGLPVAAADRLRPGLDLLKQAALE